MLLEPDMIRSMKEEEYLLLIGAELGLYLKGKTFL